ncbi:MAG: DUF4271 domain-containing protein [Ferruginibacter sp.]
MYPVLLSAQLVDSIHNTNVTGIHKDSGALAGSDSLVLKHDSINNAHIAAKPVSTYPVQLKKLFNENRLLNTTGTPVAFVNQLKKQPSRDNFFYIIIGLATLLGVFRYLYTRYFNNLFRVFFNASLRQNQLTDQLLQAKLPSLLFNILFVFTGGIYIYLLLKYYHWVNFEGFWKVLLASTLSLGCIYLIKFISLKFTGWLTGFEKITNTYVFIIFLINKILGILLIPFAIVIAFSNNILSTAAVIISLLFIGLMIVLRFFRSYGLLQHQIKVSGFHFLMYVIGVEILPVLLIYKGLVLLLSKNL